MSISKRIIPECFADTALIEYIGFGKQNHQHGVGNVINTLNEKKYKNRLAICVIDNDKQRRPSEFIEYKEINKENNLILLKRRDFYHYLIVLCPAFERWILKCTEVSGIKPSQFNLPDDFNKFKNRTKNKSIFQDENFKRYIKALKRNQAPPIVTLHNWIKEILENSYDK